VPDFATRYRFRPDGAATGIFRLHRRSVALIGCARVGAFRLGVDDCVRSNAVFWRAFLAIFGMADGRVHDSCKCLVSFRFRTTVQIAACCLSRSPIGQGSGLSFLIVAGYLAPMGASAGALYQHPAAGASLLFVRDCAACVAGACWNFT